MPPPKTTTKAPPAKSSKEVAAQEAMLALGVMAGMYAVGSGPKPSDAALDAARRVHSALQNFGVAENGAGFGRLLSCVLANQTIGLARCLPSSSPPFTAHRTALQSAPWRRNSLLLRAATVATSQSP